MIRNAEAKGSRNEGRSIRLLEAAGYSGTLTAASACVGGVCGGTGDSGRPQNALHDGRGGKASSGFAT
jgi:hypothetical protein